MRIRVINHYAVGPGTPGGTRHADLAKEWAVRGHTVDIVASQVNHFSPGVKLARAQQVADGVRLRGVPGPAYRGNGAGRVLNMVTFAVGAAVLDARSEVPDVYVGSSPHPLAALAGLVLAKTRHRPFVLEIRDLWPRTLEDLGGLRRGGIPARLLYALESLLVRNADLVVTVSAGMLDYLSERGLAPAHTLVAPNSGREPDVSGPVREDHSRVLQSLKARGDIVFCYTGTLGPANGVDAVIRAFARPGAKGASLVVVGGGSEADRLRELAEELDAPVHFFGQVSRAEVGALLHRCDVAVFHLHDGGVFRYGLSPNKLVDYLRAGMPILYAGPDTVNPTTESGCAVTAAPGDPAAIEKAIQELVAMPESERAKLGANALRRGTADYDISRVAERFLAALEDRVVTASGRARRLRLPRRGRRG